MLIDASNRTILELKLVTYHKIKPRTQASNRTILELKLLKGGFFL